MNSHEMILKYWYGIVLIFVVTTFIDKGLTMVLLGIILFVASFSFLKALLGLERKGLSCVGEICDYSIDSEGDKTPIVKFTPPGKEEIIGKPSVHTSLSIEKYLPHNTFIGENVEIRYNPSDHLEFTLQRHEGSNYAIMWLFLIAGIVLIVLGACDFLGIVELNWGDTIIN